MSRLHPSDKSEEPRAKKALKTITVDVKLGVSNHIQRGKCASDVDHVLDLNGSTHLMPQGVVVALEEDWKNPLWACLLKLL